MKIISGIIIICLVSYLATNRRLFHGNIPHWFKSLSASGLGILLIGIGLGVSGLDIISKQTYLSLSPFVQLLLAWVGLMFGAQFKVSLLKNLPFKFYFLAFGQSLLTFFILKFFLQKLLGTMGIWSDSLNTDDLGFLLAAIGCISSPTILALSIRNKKEESIGLKYLQATSSLDSIVGILAMSFLFNNNKISDYLNISSFTNYIMVIFISLALAYIFKIYFRLSKTQNEKFLMFLGMLTFTGGIAYSLHFSQLYLNLIIGVVFCNDAKISPWLDRQLTIAEKPFYLLLLIILGSMFNYSVITKDLFFLTFAFVFSRILFKSVSAFIMSKASGLNCWSFKNGLALTYQGGVSVAMIMSMITVYQSKSNNFDTTITFMIMYLILNTLLSPLLTTYGAVEPKEGLTNG